MRPSPSSPSFEPSRDAQRASGPDVAKVRAQAAVVRTLADHMARFGRNTEAEGLSEQLLEEMDRLGRFESDPAAE